MPSTSRLLRHHPRCGGIQRGSAVTHSERIDRTLADDIVRILTAVGKPMRMAIVTHVLRASRGPATQEIIDRHSLAGLPSLALPRREWKQDADLVQGICEVDPRIEIVEERWVRLSRLTVAPPSGRLTPRNAGNSWSAKEDQELREQWAAALPVSRIAVLHERSNGAIVSRLVRLCIVTDPSEDARTARDGSDGGAEREVISQSAGPKPLNHGRAWSSDDEDRFAALWEAGTRVADMAEQLGRTEGGIVAKAVDLDLVADRDKGRALARATASERAAALRALNEDRERIGSPNEGHPSPTLADDVAVATRLLLEEVYRGPLPADAQPVSDAAVWAVVDELGDRLSAVLSHRFGRHGQRHTLQDTAFLIAPDPALALSRERIRQLQAKGLQRLRHRRRMYRLIGLAEPPPTTPRSRGKRVSASGQSPIRPQAEHLSLQLGDSEAPEPKPANHGRAWQPDEARPGVTDAGLQSWLERMFGPGASFRDGQREAIEAVLRGERTLVVQRTGWGKSLVYWLATRVLRDRGRGPTLVISPLLSLMRNQIGAASALGLRASTINSGNTDEWQAARFALEHGAVDVLLVSPERLGNDEFATQILPSIKGGIGLFVVDEAHCISDWGHDFRPDYRRLRRIIAGLPPRTPLLATTATANDRVVADAVDQLGGDVRVLRGPLARTSLRLQAISLRDGAERLAWLAENLPQLPGSGIVYCLTVADTERTADWLRANGVSALAYHARLTTEVRIQREDDLLANRVKALVASTALGMGFDKPDLGFVVHYQRPGSVIAYYQQVGRAGRALDTAYGVLLSGREDDEIHDFFIRTAFPPESEMRAVLTALEGVRSARVFDLERRVNLRRARIQHILKLLEVDGAVAREGIQYFRTLNPWQPDTERIELVTQRRREELAHLRAYMTHDGCLMTYLTEALDDPTSGPCGRCAPEVGGLLPVQTDIGLVRRAVDFLRRSDRPIEPRRLWPVGAVRDLTGTINPPNEPGRALAIYGDAGWGRRVADGKYHDRRFDDELVAAAADLIGQRWRPNPAPRWATAIPSLRHPGLVGDFARRLAAALGLPFHDVLAARDVPQQKQMQNSPQQLRNVADSLSVVGEIPAGPVLLIDDIVDSRWTLTYAGWLLGHHGAGPVHPFALAVATPQDDA